MTACWSRRQVLKQTMLSLPIAGSSSKSSFAVRTSFEVLAGTDCLSEESAAGYRSALRQAPIERHGRTLIVAPGVAIERSELEVLYRRVRSGSWLLQERRPTFTGATADAGSYVKYDWPASAWVRPFGDASELPDTTGEKIATYRGKPVARRKRCGAGGVITLGSMLGPHLRAGDSHAERLLVQLVRSLSIGS